jgi:hypothetical protein
MSLELRLAVVEGLRGCFSLDSRLVVMKYDFDLLTKSVLFELR